MRRTQPLFFIILTLALVQMACNLPRAVDSNAQGTPTLPGGATPTTTLPAVITATSGPAPTSAPPTPTPTLRPANPTPTATTANTGQDGGTCTYKATFVSDVTIPDNTILPAGQSFVKTWRVRNDGTCTWGPTGYNLHSLAFASGSQFGAPDEVPLPGKVAPGQTIDVSVSMKAPAASGTFISNWIFRVDGDPSGRHWVGIGSSGNEPIFALIKVGSGSTTSATRLSFKAGATGVNVNGSLAANETKGYILAAQKDQILMALLSSPNPGPRLKITAANGAQLSGSISQEGTNAMVPLPSNQDYTVWVTAGAQASTFSLSISIPSRITFAPGGTSATVDGKVSDHLVVSYVLRASGGQTMTVALTGSNVGLTIYGLSDGQPLVRAEGGATSFDGKLPATQDYILNVVPAVDSTTFTLKVTVK